MHKLEIKDSCRERMQTSPGRLSTAAVARAGAQASGQKCQTATMQVVMLLRGCKASSKQRRKVARMLGWVANSSFGLQIQPAWSKLQDRLYPADCLK